MNNTTVYFLVTNASGIPLTGSTNSYTTPNYVTLSPTSFPLDNSPGIIDGDVQTFVPDSNGTFTCSLYPMVYKGFIRGINTHTHFILNVTSSPTPIIASDYMMVLTSSVVNMGKYAYSMAQSDARYINQSQSLASSSYALTASYALNGGSGGSSISSSWASSSISASYINGTGGTLTLNTLNVGNFTNATSLICNSLNVSTSLEVTGPLWVDTIHSLNGPSMSITLYNSSDNVIIQTGGFVVQNNGNNLFSIDGGSGQVNSTGITASLNGTSSYALNSGFITPTFYDPDNSKKNQFFF